ncbi:30S ribosomal protein S6 [Desulfovirgula thermocuniculi]|uniref:30S ribosomal protein S6 n=1 Tax=Desulfovirgula thermocuniculi TaxID=348842 RepID=UPI00040558A6|nr:30S ribosomal protein S6 [Desulfovirgula thermocuniculi]
MRSYETMYILKPELSEEAVGELVDKFKNLVENHGGEVTKLEKWGKRRLAYEIAHRREGFYVVMQFKAAPEVAQELDRVFRITEDVLRHIIVKMAA